MTIIPLSEGSFTIDKTKQFVPFNSQTDDLQQRAVGSLLVEVQPFCIITSNDVIVLDTGLGFMKDGIPQLHYNLLQHGIPPERVTKVILSHLHKDHAGGISYVNHRNQRVLSFEHATYYVQETELQEAQQLHSSSYIFEDIAPLLHSTQLHVLKGNELIEDYIQCELTHAHCKQHMVLWIKENNQTIFFGGDDAPQLRQMKNKFVAKYDFDGKKCMQLRQQWWQQGEQEKWTFLFYHDIASPTFSW